MPEAEDPFKGMNLSFVDPARLMGGQYPPPPGGRERLRAKGSVNYNQFVTMLVTLGEESMKGVLITEDEPAEDTKTPVITVGIIHKIPDPYEIKPRVRDTFPELRCKWENDGRNACTNPKCENYEWYYQTCKYQSYPPTGSSFEPEGKSVVVWGRRFKHTVQFDCWGKSVPEASRLADRLERFMFDYTGVLKLMGVSEILYNERLIDRSVKKWREDVYARSVRYLVTLEELHIRDFELISKIAVRLSHIMRQYADNEASFNMIIQEIR